MKRGIESDGARSVPEVASLPEPSGATTSEPTRFDVLLGRGKRNQQHAGNQRFQVIVDMHKDQYFAANSRHEKIHVAHQVVQAVKETGRFLKFDASAQGWAEISDTVARQKVCQSLQYRRRRKAPSTSNTETTTGAGDSSSAHDNAGNDDGEQQQQQAHPLGSNTSSFRGLSLSSAAAANFAAAPSARMEPARAHYPFPLEHFLQQEAQQNQQGQEGEPMNEADPDFQSVIGTLSRAYQERGSRDSDE